MAKHCLEKDHFCNSLSMFSNNVTCFVLTALFLDSASSLLMCNIQKIREKQSLDIMATTGLSDLSFELCLCLL
jgi:hypothetical protein